jgi:hypothetical protein
MLNMATDIVVRILRATEKGENEEPRSEDFVVLTMTDAKCLITRSRPVIYKCQRFGHR